MDMRTLLKALMALADENAYGLESRSGVPQATINRFLTGKVSVAGKVVGWWTLRNS